MISGFCPGARRISEVTEPGFRRQYLPKSTDLAEHDQTDLDLVAIKRNGRRRQTLDWHTPADKRNQLSAMTD